MKTFLFALVSAACLVSVSAISCYSCESESDSKCVNGTENAQEVECDAGITMCSKVILEDKHTGHIEASRSCVFDKNVKVGCKESKSGSLNVHCVCDSDLCNGAETNNAGAMAVLGAAVASALLAKTI